MDTWALAASVPDLTREKFSLVLKTTESAANKLLLRYMTTRTSARSTPDDSIFRVTTVLFRSPETSDSRTKEIAIHSPQKKEPAPPKQSEALDLHGPGWARFR